MADGLNDENEKFIEKDEVDVEHLGNPAPPPDVDMDLLRGDRIGDTVYSGKWCIQIVMKLLQSNVVAKTAEGEDRNDLEDMDEDLQNEVGALWDMTVNVEVCQYLQSTGAVESIYHVVANSKCPRATEMCVGMLANMVSHEELWQSLHSDETLFAILIPLLSHTDQPLLLELSRFFNTALNHEDNGCCYESLFDNGPLVSQELLRILSGSTNGDLLRQVSELTYILMSLDENDSQFNTLFADGDFVSGVLEASKEFGFRQESTGQERVMDILHCFTTYEAGIAAIEPCMEQITRGVVQYLKTLCQGLNLSHNCNVITVIIRILNHIFCRSLPVRIELMSSSSLVHCMLKTLVSVYRRLGMHDSIASAPNNSKTTKRGLKISEEQLSSKLSAISSPSWENLPSEEGKKSRETATSWSERAGQSEAAGQSYRTPDASPQPSHQMKEFELSWSERRIASPLGMVRASQNECDWKRPAERKRRMKRIEQGKGTSREEKYDNDNEANEDGEREEEEEKSEAEERERELKEEVTAQDGRPVFGEKKDGEKNTSLNEASKNSPSHQCEKEESCVSIDKRICSTDSSTSEGFEPSQDSLHEPDSVGEIMDLGEKFNAVDEIRQITKTDTVGEEECQDGDRSQLSTLTDTPQWRKDEQSGMQSNDKLAMPFGHENYNNSKSAQQEKEGDCFIPDEDENSKENLSVSSDRYHVLLDVLREFMMDFFNNIRESLTTEAGEPILAVTMRFLNTQCSSAYLRALAKCLSPHRSLSEPLDRLLHLATRLKASHLHKVLSESLPFS